MLTIENLVKEYVDGDTIVRPLNGVNLTAEDGELMLLLGPSGSGKTTLLSCLAGLLKPTSGSIRVGDTDVVALDSAGMAEYRRHGVGVVFQAFNLISSMTARENVMVPMRLAGWSASKSRRRADELLEQVNLSQRASHKPNEMSGGQQQRVAIARALALDPPLILADEPTAHLDFVQVQTVISLLRDLAKPGRTLVVATHDDRLVPVSDRAVDLVTAARGPEPSTRTITLAAGSVLFEEGELSSEVYVVESGSIEIYTKTGTRNKKIRTVGKGSYFGEVGPLLGLPRSASARAATRAVLTAYDVQDFRRLVGTRERERLTSHNVEV